MVPNAQKMTTKKISPSFRKFKAGDWKIEAKKIRASLNWVVL